MIHISCLPSSTVALHNTPQHSHESDFMGFMGKKQNPRGAYALFCHTDFILTCHAKFLILFYMMRSIIHDPTCDPVSDLIHDLVWDPICDLIRSDLVWSSQIQILLAPQTQGHFRLFQYILEITQGHFRSF